MMWLICCGYKVTVNLNLEHAVEASIQCEKQFQATGNNVDCSLLLNIAYDMILEKDVRVPYIACS